MSETFSFDEFLSGFMGAGGGGDPAGVGGNFQLTQMAAATGNPYAIAAAAAADTVMAFVSRLGFRRGAGEADAIVPSQNELHHTILAPAVVAKDNPASTLAELRQWRTAVANANAAFLAFIRDPKFSADGDTRASDQAYQTMFGTPGYARQVLADLDAVIAARGGGSAGGAGAVLAAIGGGNGNLGFLMLLGIGSLFLLRR